MFFLCFFHVRVERVFFLYFVPGKHVTCVSLCVCVSVCVCVCV